MAAAASRAGNKPSAGATKKEFGVRGGAAISWYRYLVSENAVIDPCEM